ncbi:hypothetical protein ACS5PN_01935 [Roseateles sp. NT4]|uniref:hypothetical protein n=1 Tax=Roseateles sp. NT4 TaxID=3453715 RepID=UPI003EEB5F62
MKRVLLVVGLGWLAGSCWAQQVWRCETDGLVRYTDQPCEKSGRPLPARNLKANVADSLATEAAHAATSGASQAAETPASAPAAEADEAAAVKPAPPVQQVSSTSSRRGHRSARAPQFAMQGLMDTDFVQRGYVPRRQNPPSTPNPSP